MFSFQRVVARISLRTGHRGLATCKRPISRGGAKWILRATVAGGALYAVPSVRDDLDFAAHAVQRTTTVAVALTRCVLAYRRTLKAHYNSEEDYAEALSACHTHCATITRKALERNAGIFIKFGQHISALTYIFPHEWTNAMIPLQDECPVTSFEDVQQLFINDMGISVSDLFSEFNHLPMGTASLAQVHLARLRDSGEEVAVKVQHATLRRYVPLDIRLTETVFKMVGYFFPQYPMSWLSEEMRRSIFVELDFRKEAENAQNCDAYFKSKFNKTALRIPKVHWAEPRILCMEFLTGIRPDDLECLKRAGVDCRELSLCFAHLFNDMIFTPGVGLHCDPHAGNIAIKPTTSNKHGFEIVLYDHGLYRYVDAHTRLAYAHFWLAIMDGDQEAMKTYAKKFANISADGFKVFAAVITGRDFTSSADGSVARRPRSQEEISRMQKSLQEDDTLATRIMQMLQHIPPAVLLIFKTNDLVRYLAETLGTPLGITKEYAIMASYCASTVYNQEKHGSVWNWLKASTRYVWTLLRLQVLTLMY